MNTLKQLQEKAREIWENKAEDFTYEDLDELKKNGFLPVKVATENGIVEYHFIN